MTGENFEYAIKKDVRNNPIVREIDRERHIEMLRTTLVGVFVVSVLVFFVWRRSTLLTHGYEVGTIQSEIVALEKENRERVVQITMLRRPSRIEPLARKLGMVTPGPDDQGVIERVVPSPPPPRTVVARR
jgi:cell division protein FtsL